MYASKFQTGSSGVEIFSPSGSDPLKKLKLNNEKQIQRIYDRSVKGYILEMNRESSTTSVQCPRNVKESLDIIQPFLVFQLKLFEQRSFSLELVIHDTQRQRKRLYFSSNFKDIDANHVQAKIPWCPLENENWQTVVLDMSSLVSSCFPGSAFESLDSFSIHPVCQIRKIFSLPTEPIAGHISPQLDFPAGVVSNTKVLAAPEKTILPVRTDLPLEIKGVQSKIKGHFSSDEVQLKLKSNNNRNNVEKRKKLSTISSKLPMELHCNVSKVEHLQMKKEAAEEELHGGASEHNVLRTTTSLEEEVQLNDEKHRMQEIPTATYNTFIDINGQRAGAPQVRSSSIYESLEHPILSSSVDDSHSSAVEVEQNANTITATSISCDPYTGLQIASCADNGASILDKREILNLCHAPLSDSVDDSIVNPIYSEAAARALVDSHDRHCKSRNDDEETGDHHACAITSCSGKSPLFQQQESVLLTMDSEVDKQHNANNIIALEKISKIETANEGHHHKDNPSPCSLIPLSHDSVDYIMYDHDEEIKPNTFAIDVTTGSSLIATAERYSPDASTGMGTPSVVGTCLQSLRTHLVGCGINCDQLRKVLADSSNCDALKIKRLVTRLIVAERTFVDEFGMHDFEQCVGIYKLHLEAS